MVSRDLLLGMALGGTLAFLADPQAGRRRRALARDKVIRASRKTRDALDATSRDIANRASGVIAATRGRFTNASVDDARLVDRVRAKLGRVCSHPHAIDVDALDGMVVLRGPILARELDAVIAMAERVPGVRAVTSHLEPHETAYGIPALQGEGQLGEPSLDVLQRNWAPATQALVAAAGLAATGYYIAAYTRR